MAAKAGLAAAHPRRAIKAKRWSARVNASQQYMPAFYINRAATNPRKCPPVLQQTKGEIARACKKLPRAA